MTLIFALKCTDGVVFASDGQETIETSCESNPIKTTTCKIKSLGQNLWAAFGDLSIIQRIESDFKRLEQESPNISWLNEPQRRQRILEHVLNIRRQELNRHRRLYGEDKDRDACKAKILIVGCNEKPIVWHIDEDAVDECLQETDCEATGSGDIEATGSGDIFAYAIFRTYDTILRNYNIELSIYNGSLLAYRILRSSIDTSASGLGDPIDIRTIKCEGKCEEAKVEKVKITELEPRYSDWLKQDAEILRKRPQ